MEKVKTGVEKYLEKLAEQDKMQKLTAKLTFLKKKKK